MLKDYVTNKHMQHIFKTPNLGVYVLDKLLVCGNLTLIEKKKEEKSVMN